ncbi:MAG TPA: elongation factor G [Planctomycetes bacterium]|nr:elongation factor G [Planctomycetota bacterium]
MPSDLRNIGIVAHIDAGKTTVSERILFYSGVERRMGEVHEGSTVMDWMEEERRRGITITAAAASVPWRGKTINLVDTPGHVDFTVEVERCMRVLEGAVLVLNGVAGVQAQSETVWRQMCRHRVASLAFVNQLDRPGGDYLGAVESLRERLEAPAIAVQYPIGEGKEFRGVVDLVRMRALHFSADTLGKDPEVIAVPPEVEEEALVLRSELIETLAEGDEAVLAAFLDETEPDEADLVRALRARVLERSLVPVLAGAALRNVGVQPLLDAIVDYLPAPEEVQIPHGFDPASGEEVTPETGERAPVVAFAYKFQADRNEDLLFTRILAGTVRPGQKLFNPRVKRMERIARVLRMHADSRHPLEEAGPGEIVALTGAKFTVTGDTLCEHDHALVLEPLVFPEPVITRVVEPGSTADRDKLHAALERLSFEDPTFHVREDAETGQWLIAGMGELHLEVLEHRLREDFGLEVHVGTPRVAYREAPRRVSRGSGRVDRMVGGERVFGALDVEVVPIHGGDEEETGGAVLVEFAPDCLVPDGLREAVRECLSLEAQVGPRFGFQMGGLRVVVHGGESHPGRDAELGFNQAASMALREALAGADVALLEPVMSFQIEAPPEFMSGILGDLQARRAEVQDLQADEGARRVRGVVPLYRMFGYASVLRSLSQGRAGFSLTPSGFREVPESELAERGLVWS